MLVICKEIGVIRNCARTVSDFKKFVVLKKEVCNVYLVTELLSSLSKLDCLPDSLVGQMRKPQRGEMNGLDRITGVDITGRMEKPPAIKEVIYSITISMIWDTYLTH